MLGKLLIFNLISYNTVCNTNTTTNANEIKALTRIESEYFHSMSCFSVGLIPFKKKKCRNTPLTAKAQWNDRVLMLKTVFIILWWTNWLDWLCCLWCTLGGEWHGWSDWLIWLCWLCCLCCTLGGEWHGWSDWLVDLAMLVVLSVLYSRGRVAWLVWLIGWFGYVSCVVCVVL